MQGNLHVRFLEGGGAERLRLHSVRRPETRTSWTATDEEGMIQLTRMPRFSQRSGWESLWL